MKRVEKLSKKEQEELIVDLMNALVKTESIQEAALFLQDLLTINELSILSKRLRIAKLLLIGMTYDEIQEELHVGHSTVAKISVWLAQKGEGFRKLIKKLPKQSEEEFVKDISQWDTFKRQYSLYFWPELLLEEIIKSASKKQKQQITGVLETLEEKSELHKRIEKLLSPKV